MKIQSDIRLLMLLGPLVSQIIKLSQSTLLPLNYHLGTYLVKRVSLWYLLERICLLRLAFLQVGLNYFILPGKYLYKKHPTLHISIFTLTRALSTRSVFVEVNLL